MSECPACRFQQVSGPLQFSPHSRVRVREPTDVDRTREKSIVIGRKLRRLLPQLQPLHEFICDGKRSARAVSLNIIHVLLDNAALDSQLAVKPVQVRPLQSQALRYSQPETYAQQSDCPERFS